MRRALPVYVLLAALGCTRRTEEPRAASAIVDQAQQCGQCHVAQLQQWSRSRKHGAGSNPVFLATLELARKDLGAAGAKECLSCHSGGDGPDAIGCESCHRVLDVKKDEKGRFVAELAEDSVTGPETDSVPRHRYAARSIFAKGELCAPCHSRVHQPANLEIAATYDTWSTSWHASKGTTCQSCHMEKYDGRALHSFVGAYNDIWVGEAIAVSMEKSPSGAWHVLLGNSGSAHQVPGEALDLREIEVSAIWLNAEGKELGKTSVASIGPAFEDDQGRAVPFWRATRVAKRDHALVGDRPTAFDVTPLPSATGVRIDVVYHRVSPRLGWILSSVQARKSRVLGTRFDLATGKPQRSTDPLEDW